MQHWFFLQNLCCRCGNKGFMRIHHLPCYNVFDLRIRFSHFPVFFNPVHYPKMWFSKRASCFASYALAFLFMSMGFEFGWALMVLLFFMIIMLKVARDCELGCLAWCQSSAPRRRSVQVHPVFEVVIVPHHPLQTDSPSAPPLELLECARIFPVEECPICFEGVDVDKSWQSLRCGHTFHAACIETWPRKTCPVCRKPYGWFFHKPNQTKKIKNVDIVYNCI